MCETNAKYEGVADRIKFIQASASDLPFREKEFDIVVSCLTFHEVKDEADKKVLKEALRVLKKDGEFVFLDLFLDEKIFGENDEFFNRIRSLGISEIKVEKLENIIKLPPI
ncbi:class I SAM-dependent methyltransferase [Paraclostridium benzoelyticum]|uniref:class I SAM-dependent methyltransferase n=1 Tax=Paraclostridium benzoelyticum TaxID=1629550 RepID=UPI0031CD0DEF